MTKSEKVNNSFLLSSSSSAWPGLCIEENWKAHNWTHREKKSSIGNLFFFHKTNRKGFLKRLIGGGVRERGKRVSLAFVGKEAWDISSSFESYFAVVVLLKRHENSFKWSWNAPKRFQIRFTLQFIYWSSLGSRAKSDSSMVEKVHVTLKLITFPVGRASESREREQLEALNERRKILMN